jgi:hypothetical protein
MLFCLFSAFYTAFYRFFAAFAQFGCFLKWRDCEQTVYLRAKAHID